jgi:ParB-like chromosome segregation protein Spo0J
MLQWIKVGDLVIDETYQRPIRGAGAKNIAAIAEAFSWSKFAPLIVSPVAGGRYAVIDGQHRATAAALRGVEALPAQIIIADTMEQAAAFKAVNGQTTRMHALEIHRAGVAGGDAEAIEIERVCAEAGASISPHPRCLSRLKPGETLAIGALRSRLRLHGPENVILALRCAGQGVNSRPGVLSGVVVEALCGMVAAAEDVQSDPESLVEAFQRIVIQREADKARFQPRDKGVGHWEVLRDRLLQRVGEQRRAHQLARAS